MNAIGNLLSATDNGGTINYLYHSSGQPVSIAAVGATTTIEYDAYGRQVKLIDPDAGTTKYTYNAFGELASQTNANNYTDTICYDILGRVTQNTRNRCNNLCVQHQRPSHRTTGLGNRRKCHKTGVCLRQLWPHECLYPNHTRAKYKVYNLVCVRHLR